MTACNNSWGVGGQLHHRGFLTGDPVINLDDQRTSVNEVPTAVEPKGFVPLIGSEVDVSDISSGGESFLSRHRMPHIQIK